MCVHKKFAAWSIDSRQFVRRWRWLIGALVIIQTWSRSVCSWLRGLHTVITGINSLLITAAQNQMLSRPVPFRNLSSNSLLTKKVSRLARNRLSHLQVCCSWFNRSSSSLLTESYLDFGLFSLLNLFSFTETAGFFKVLLVWHLIDAFRVDYLCNTISGLVKRLQGL